MTEMSSIFDPYEVHLGRLIATHDHMISAEMVERYVAGTEDGHLWYFAPSPLGVPLAPALVLHSEVYSDLSWYLPNLIGNLHARQEWELFAPLHVGDRVRTQIVVVDRYQKRNRDYVVAEVLVTDTAGRWLQRSRTHQSFLSELPAGEVVVDKQREQRADRHFEVGSAVGESLVALQKTISLGMCQAFSGPARNYHTDREMAQAMGFPDVVVQGMMSICFVSELMTRNFGLGWWYGGKLDVSLVNVVWPEDCLRICGQVQGTRMEGRRVRVRCQVWAEKENGVKTLVGTASALREKG